MVVRMRHTRAHTRNRRSHHALEAVKTSVCQNCKKSHIRHRACENCGQYKGVEVIDTLKIVARKELRKKTKEKSLGLDTNKKTVEKVEAK